MNKLFVVLLFGLQGAAALAQGRVPPPLQALPAGLYVQVLDGMIHVTNPGGSSNFAAGQFGYTASMTQPPVIVPSNPGIQFTPPPSFSSSATPSGMSSAKSNTVDCEVR